jgi:transposase
MSLIFIKTWIWAILGHLWANQLGNRVSHRL